YNSPLARCCPTGASLNRGCCVNSPPAPSMAPDPARPDRLSQIEEIYHAASRLPPDQRLPYLEQACGGSETLRREGDSLLEAHDRGGELLEAPALAVAAALSPEPRPPSRIASRSGVTASSARWEPAAWGKYIEPKIPGWTARWLLKSCPLILQTTPRL